MFRLHVIFLIICVIPIYCRFTKHVHFEGIYPTVFTPFDKTGELNVSIIPLYARYLKNSGVDGVIVADVVGEGLCLSISEKKKLVDAWVSACKPLSLQVIVNIGAIALVDKIELAKYYELIGIDGLQLSPRSCHIPDHGDYIEQFLITAEEISKAVSLPFTYYDIPKITKIWVDLPTLFKKASKKFPQFLGITADMWVAVNVTAQVYLRKDQFIAITSDFSIASGTLNGFKTFSVVTANFLPRLVKDIISYTKAGEISKARKAQERLIEIYVSITSLGHDIATLKAAMEIITGIKVGVPRKPATPLSQRTLKYLTRILEEYNIETTAIY